MDKHHIVPAIQRQGRDRLHLQVGPVRKGHLQQQRAGALHTQQAQRLLFHLGEIGHLRPQHHPGQARRRGGQQPAQSFGPAQAEGCGSVLTPVIVGRRADGRDLLGLQTAQHGHRCFDVGAAVIHGGQQVGMQVCHNSQPPFESLPLYVSELRNIPSRRAVPLHPLPMQRAAGMCGQGPAKEKSRPYGARTVGTQKTLRLFFTGRGTG